MLSPLLSDNDDNDSNITDILYNLSGDNLLEKRREFPQAIDLYKTYDNHHLVSKLLAEVIHYYLNEYLVNQTNDGTHPEDQITRKQIETIETNFKEAIEKQDYLTYFIKAYTLTTFFYRVLNKHLALFVLEYFDKTKDFSSNYRLVNCLVHIVTLIIYHPNLPQYRYKGLCYRGMRITQNDLNQYRLNQHILNRTFLSTSDDRQVAEMFSGEGQQSKMRFTPGNKAKATIPRYNNSVEGWHNAFANRVALNHPNIVKLAEKIRREQSKFEVDITKILQVIKIKQNDLDDSTAPISIEIELEECEDPNDNKDESESGETLRTLSISSCDSDIKDTQSYVNFKQRNYLLYGIIGVLMLLIVVILSFIFIFTLVLKNNPTENTINMPPFVQKEDNEIDYHLP
ncbi:unnamed protein product [Rotaria socialis]|uniref:Uncharacterized protein n=1 Tax=Rotaria socialis TaxID=392032 RepID=A0A817VQS2_9BILA|nr:unnamed protein product [Rotaria socialis]